MMSKFLLFVMWASNAAYGSFLISAAYSSRLTPFELSLAGGLIIFWVNMWAWAVLAWAEHALAKLLRGGVDVDRYFTETEKVRVKYEEDREDAVRRGTLPRFSLGGGRS